METTSTSRSCSATSSPLRELSRSPTPPSFIKTMPRQLPTPPSSQSSKLSSIGTCTPRSDLDVPGGTLSQESDGSPPHKRRRLNASMPRETRYLDLEELGAKGAAALPKEQEQLDRLVKCLRKKRKIVVVAGAGISVSAGIPDFRSREGLFKTLKDTHNLKGSGKQLFDASVYRDADSTSHFHDMVREMSHLSRAAKPTPFHHLIARLAHEGRLLRLYSQNVDGLETCLEPLKSQTPLPSKGPWPKTVQLHGGLEKMVCTKCQQTSDFQADLFDGPVPPFCGVCEELDHVRTEVAGKRSHGVGRLRPRMVLYNEHNPDDEAIGSVMKHDLRIRPDAVIVVGTSCKVPGVKRIVRETCAVVRDRRDGLTVWLNNDPIPTAKELESCWDLVVKGTADEVAQRAALGRWDDPEVVVEGVDEARAQAAKERETVQVVVESPKKVTKHFDAIKDAVATAREQDACKREEEQRSHSPDATAMPLAAVDLGSHPATAAPKATTAKSKLKNPASKGLTIDGYLNKAAGITTEPQAPTTKSKRATKSSTASSTPAATELAKPTTTTTTKKPRAPRKPRAPTKAQQAVAGTASIKSTFKTSKAAAVPKPKTRAASAAKKIGDGGQAPAVVVDTDSGVRRDSTMDVLPDSSARVNSACSSPTSAERVVDGSKLEKEADADASDGNTGLLRIAAKGFSKWVGGAAS